MIRLRCLARFRVHICDKKMKFRVKILISHLVWVPEFWLGPVLLVSISKARVYVPPISIDCNVHWVKSARVRSCSGPYFPAFGLNMERYWVSLDIQSECGKIWTRIIPNTDTFHAVVSNNSLLVSQHKRLYNG